MDQYITHTQHEDAIVEAASRIRAASAIALVLPEMIRYELGTAASALAFSLRAAQKITTTFWPRSFATGDSISAEYLGDSEPLRELVISCDVTKSPIRELRYERDHERLDIILSPLSAPIRKEDIAFRAGSLHYELVVTLGVTRPETALANLDRAPELLHEKPAVNIDTNPENTRFGEINVIDPNYSFAELCARLLDALGAPMTDPAPSLLLSSLAAATNGLSPRQMNADRFLLAGSLVRAGASLERALDAREKLPTPPLRVE